MRLGISGARLTTFFCVLIAGIGLLSWSSENVVFGNDGKKSELVKDPLNSSLSLYVRHTYIIDLNPLSKISMYVCICLYFFNKILKKERVRLHALAVKIEVRF